MRQVAGGDRRVKVAENNSAIPQDRILFNYNHFHNAIERNRRDLVGPVVSDGQFDVDRCTFGIEKTFLDGLWSVEIRMLLARNGLAAEALHLLTPHVAVDLLIGATDENRAEEAIFLELGRDISKPFVNDQLPAYE